MTRVKKVPNIAWNKDPKFIIGSIAIPLLVAFLTAPWWANLLSNRVTTQQEKKFSQSEHKPDRVSSGSATTTLILSSPPNLRALKPLETGKKIGELPNGVYFYSSPLSIEYEVEDQTKDFLEASSQDNAYYFELQKINSRYYLIGFISNEAHSEIGSRIEEPVFTQLFANYWGGAENLVAIPFDSIYSLKTREINLDEKKSISIFDIGFKEAIENPEFHKIKKL